MSETNFTPELQLTIRFCIIVMVVLVEMVMVVVMAMLVLVMVVEIISFDVLSATHNLHIYDTNRWKAKWTPK